MLEHGTVVGDYRIESLLGRGGMGTVFRARHTGSGRVVALKLLGDQLRADPDSGARLRREGRAQASLEHPNVVTIYDAGDSEHGLYLAMRLIDGPRLADLIGERELSARRTLTLLGQVADALDAAHAVGLVHRDVKPHNVLVGAGDHACLADFGLTRVGGATALTATGALAGTVAYLAPEVVRGGEASAASDRYAFAAMAFECLTGGVVFPRATEAGVLFAHAGDPPPRISSRRPELGTGLDALFERALAKEPSQRPASARELVDAIARELARSGAVELPAPPPIGAAALAAGGADETAAAAPPRAAEVAASPPGASPPGSAPPGATPSERSATAPSRRRRRKLALALAAALGSGALVLAATALLGDGETPAARALAPDRPGLRYVGAGLDGPAGRALDCRGRLPQPGSPACTVVQSGLPGATLVVPVTGAIRQWSVRAAQGELTLVVLRPRDGGVFQVTTSRTETVGSADVQVFDTDLDVDRGDLVGLLVAGGSGAGVRSGVAGATTERWLPPVAGAGRPADRGAGSGFDHELLLRVGLLPGARRRLPPEVTGSAAARLPAGRERARRSVRLAGRRLDLVLVDVGGRFALDAIAGGRRFARIDVPELRPQAQIVRFVAASWAPDVAGLDLHFVNAGSAAVVQLGYAVTARQFERIR